MKRYKTDDQPLIVINNVEEPPLQQVAQLFFITSIFLCFSLKKVCNIKNNGLCWKCSGKEMWKIEVMYKKKQVLKQQKILKGNIFVSLTQWRRKTN